MYNVHSFILAKNHIKTWQKYMVNNNTLATEPSRRFHYFAATEPSRIDGSVAAKYWNHLDCSIIIRLRNRQ